MTVTPPNDDDGGLASELQDLEARVELGDPSFSDPRDVVELFEKSLAWAGIAGCRGVFVKLSRPEWLAVVLVTRVRLVDGQLVLTLETTLPRETDHAE